MPAQMTIKKSIARIGGEPGREIDAGSFQIAAFVADMGETMCAMRVVRVRRYGPLDLGPGRRKLPILGQRHGVIGQEPEVVAVMRGQAVHQHRDLALLSDAAGAASRIMALETKIAQAHATREESEDFAKAATVWSRAELERNAPGIDWGALLGAAQLGNAQKFQAYHAGAIPKLARLVGTEPLDAWKEWLAFHTLSQQANVLANPIRDASFAFFGTALNGTPQQRPRKSNTHNSGHLTHAHTHTHTHTLVRSRRRANAKKTLRMWCFCEPATSVERENVCVCV